MLVTGLTGTLLLTSLVCLKFVKYNNNIELMLPADRQVQQSMRFLRESNFSDKLVISLKLNDSQHTTEDLITACDQLAGSIDTPLVKNIINSIDGSSFMPEMIFFLQYTPQLLGPESLAKLKDQITPAGIKERLSFIYRQSLSPQSSFVMPFLRADPLNLNSRILNNIQKLSKASGYDVTINRGHLLSKDGRYAMIILKTSVLLTDGFGSRNIIHYLQEKLKPLPKYIKADIIAGHMHTVKNEDIIKKDICLTTIIASWGFILLFLFAFRDWKAMIIFLIPLGAVLITTGISFLIFGELSYFVIGLSTVIAGIADDYGIYVYMAVRKAGNSLETMNKIRRPVVVGALTTISVFIVFFFSSVKGYHQLAFFSNFAIIICLAYSLFILPHYIKQEKPVQITAETKPIAKFNLGIPDKIWLSFWIILMIIMAGLSTQLKFNNDITQFDGPGKEVAKNEMEFRSAWGNKDLPAVFVIQAKTLEDAYELNDAVYTEAVQAVGQENFKSFASIWPGFSKRQANLKSWKEFWTNQKIQEFKNLLAEYGTPYNFSPEAFAPFVQKLDNPATLKEEPEGLVFFEQLKDQFVFKKSDAYQIISFFPDQNNFITKLSGLKEKYPGSFLVSRKNFSRQVSQALSREFLYLGLLAVLLTLCFTAILLKNLRLTIIAIIPIITSLASIAGVTYLAGLSLNIPAVIATMVVMGLVSDYGIFMVYYCKYHYQTGTIPAVTLASITTIIGTAVLLFAQHPILFSIGLTLTTGVLIGYLCSMIIIPVAYRLWKDKKDVPI
ncbi:MAG: hypothetical protein NT014_07000 [Candidatus Omnitrophica bacterium]|nr:hypothetical protein [Candidatus Omnitrophota bacterium]